MPATNSSPGDAPNSVVYQIVTELKQNGLGHYDYRLYDILDPDALEELVASADPSIRICFEVREFGVTVFGNGVVDVQPP